MRAAILTSFDSPPEFGEFDEPEAREGAALIEVSTAGLNPIDRTIASGVVPGRVPPLPSVPGLEGVGTLDGRRVYFDTPIRPSGSLAERALVDAEATIGVPDGLDDGLAISFGIAGLAAWLALTWRGRLERGESVLVLGASGVVGQIAVQGARLLGASRVVAAARDRESLERAKSELGADATVELDGGDDLGERLGDAGNGGFDVVIDPVWGESAATAITTLNRFGRLVQIGNAAGPSAEIAARGFRNQLASIIGHTNFHAPQERKRDCFEAMCRHAAAGELTVEVERVGLERIAEVWERDSPHRKLVVEV